MKLVVEEGEVATSVWRIRKINEIVVEDEKRKAFQVEGFVYVKNV